LRPVFDHPDLYRQDPWIDSSETVDRSDSAPRGMIDVL
jgi:hypothetical protein